MLLPSAHFLVSTRNILLNCAEDTALTPFCFDTTTAMWCAKHGAAEIMANKNIAALRELFTFIHSLRRSSYLKVTAGAEITKVFKLGPFVNILLIAGEGQSTGPVIGRGSGPDFWARTIAPSTMTIPIA